MVSNVCSSKESAREWVSTSASDLIHSSLQQQSTRGQSARSIGTPLLPPGWQIIPLLIHYSYLYCIITYCCT